MSIQAPPVCWDVRNFVLDVERDEANERIQENYRKINLFATLMWNMTHLQFMRLYPWPRIIEYWLDETADRAFEYGFFLSKADHLRFRAAAEDVAGIPELRDKTCEYLYCQDVQPPFPWARVVEAFTPMSEAGLCLPFLLRKCLEPIPRTQRVMDDFLKSFGDFTVAMMYDTSPPPYFTGKDFAALKMAKRLQIFGGKDNDRACDVDECVRQQNKWCSSGEEGCAVGSDPYE